MAFRVTGKNASESFANEAGGHRFQRVPPTEKRGRVHTSTITVAVLPELKEGNSRLDPSDLSWKFCRGSGCGGQHRNKTDSAVQLTHIPSGMMVRCEKERDQHKNKKTALTWLSARLAKQKSSISANKRNSHRKRQLGSGMRGDKRRTIAIQRNSVIDHITGKKIAFSKYERGDFRGL